MSLCFAYLARKRVDARYLLKVCNDRTNAQGIRLIVVLQKHRGESMILKRNNLSFVNRSSIFYIEIP